MQVLNTSRLTPAEGESLEILIEECAEVIQAATKILRHGKKATDWTGPTGKTYDNLSLLSSECADVMAALRLCDSHELLVGDRDELVKYKLKRMQAYLHHNDTRQLIIDFDA